MWNSYAMAAAGLLVLVSLLHSALGERFVVQPALRAAWGVPHESFLKRTLRFAWHLTSFAWVGLAAIALIGRRESLDVIAVVTTLSGLAALFGSRAAHLAWPIFLSATTFLQLAAHGPARFEGLLQTGAVAGLVFALLAVSALHAYWAFGGRRGLAGAVPQAPKADAPVFTPGPALTLLVAAVIGGYAALVAATFLGAGPAWLRYVVVAGSVVFLLRVVGDFRYCGLSKQILGTSFARRDTAIYVPLCFALSWASFVCVL